MEKIILYFNNECSKSNCALDLLREKHIEPEIVNYVDGHLTEAELKHVLKLLGIPAEQLVRKGEPVYKELYAGRQLTEQEWIAAMLQHPILIERPIIIKGNKAIIARPPERVREMM